MPDELLRELPRDLPSFLKRFGTVAECRAYLVRALWPDGFRCSGCGHRAAWSHKQRLIEECRFCGKQHSILAGTMFEQTKTGLSKGSIRVSHARRNLPSSGKQLRETRMERETFQAWLAEADGLSARRREEAVLVLAEPASLASVLALLEGRIDETRRCPHCAVEGPVIPIFSIVGARTGSNATSSRAAARPSTR